MLIRRQDSLLGYRVYDITYRDQTYRLPSVTSILSAYPVSVAILKYYGDKGFDKAIELRDAAGEVGSSVHDALHEMFSGQTVSLVERSPEEAIMIHNAHRWYLDTEPTITGSEMTVFNLIDGWAGTLDLLLGDEIIDFKSSKDIWETHKIQVATYAHATHVVTPKGVRRMPQISSAKIIRLDKSQTKVGYKLFPGPRQKKEFNLAADYQIFKHLIPVYKRHNPNWNLDDPILELPDTLALPLKKGK